MASACGAICIGCKRNIPAICSLMCSHTGRCCLFLGCGSAYTHTGDAGPAESATQEENSGETAEQHTMRRIKAWNVAVRVRPHELQLWLDFAAFQDEISK